MRLVGAVFLTSADALTRRFGTGAIAGRRLARWCRRHVAVITEGLMKLLHENKSDRSMVALLSGALALAAVTAGWVQRRARQAERENHPEGQLL